MRKICSKLSIKAPDRHHWRPSVVFIVNFEQISHIVPVIPLLALNKLMSAVGGGGGIFRSEFSIFLQRQF